MTPSLKCNFTRMASASPSTTVATTQATVHTDADGGCGNNEQAMSGVEGSEDDENYEDVSEESSEGGQAQEGQMMKAVSQSLNLLNGYKGTPPPLAHSPAFPSIFESITTTLDGFPFSGTGWKVYRKSPDLFSMSGDSHSSENLNSTTDMFDDDNNAALLATAIDFEINDEILAAKNVMETEFELEHNSSETSAKVPANEIENVSSPPILVLSATPENVVTISSNTPTVSASKDQSDDELSLASFQNQMQYFQYHQFSDPPLNASLQEFSLRSTTSHDSAYNTQLAGQAEQLVSQPYQAIHHCDHTLTLERRVCCYCDVTLHDTDDALESPCYGSVLMASGSCVFAETFPYPSLA